MSDVAINDWIQKLSAATSPQVEEPVVEPVEENVTSNLDELETKMAQAEDMGRELAREQGDAVLADTVVDAQMQDFVANLSDEEAVKLAEMLDNGLDKEAFLGMGALKGGLGALKGIAGKAMKSNTGSKLLGKAVNNPNAAMAAGGAALGAAGAGEGNRMSGALLGGAGGYGAGRMGAGKMLQKGLVGMPAKLATSKAKTVAKGLALLGGGAGVGGLAGHSKGRETGTREGFGTGARVGYRAGARKGYTAGAHRGYMAGVRRGWQARSKASKKSQEKKAFFNPR